MDTQKFWQCFNAKALEQALQIFKQLSDSDKSAIFAQLFQRSHYQKMPHSISVLFRELHPDKSFADFHQAWFPAKEHLNTTEIAGETFQQCFPAPTRVINAVNIENEKEIVSVGLHWLTDTQAEKMLEVANAKSNQQRGDPIDKVANKIKTGIYKVESDDNLGTAF